MIIDLTKLNKETASLFNENKQIVLADYIKLTDDLQKRSSDITWLLNNVTSKNTNFSKLFYYMRCEKLIDDISKSSEIEDIITDDMVLGHLLSSKFKVTVNNKKKKNSFFHFLHVLYRCFIWSLGGLSCKSKQRISNLKSIEGATIIDTDIAKKADKYNDRYYGNVLDSLPNDITKDFFYNIIYLPNPRKKDIALVDKNTPYNTVYLWDFLKPVDYITALFGMLRRDKKRLLNYEYLGINQRPVLKAVYNDSISFYYYLAFLYERVIYRMKQSGVKIRLYIDWFENQSFDKSFHWAMNKYYPKTKVHSYIGFMADTKENPITIATNTELSLGIAPQYIYTCNEALRDQYLNSGYQGIVRKAPFYRANSIWDVSKNTKTNKVFTILVPLGLNKNEVEFKTRFFTSLRLSDNQEKINVIIKPHPVYDEKSIKQIIDGFDFVSIVGGNIYDYLPNADAVVASNSTTTYEALALGIPLLYIVDPEFKLSLNKPEKCPSIMWNEIGDNNSIWKAIESIKSIDNNRFEAEGTLLKEYFFTKQNSELTACLFGI